MKTSNANMESLPVLLAIVLSVINLCLCQDDTIIVTVQQGQLRGKSATTVNGLQYHSFQAIPYAKRPTYKLRFKDPEPAESWDGVRDALEEGMICPQMGFANNYDMSGDEDCLFVNVYTPALASDSEDAMPVMVWIHGGAYQAGSGNIEGSQPDYLLEAGVIVVTMNYRLSAIGFLSTGDDVISGNFGLKDQVMALQWVQDNIEQFGGNPNQVTIFGQSAGGSSIHYLVISPMAKGLFQAAIAESGSALGSTVFESREKARERTKRLCEALDLDSDNSTEILEYLQDAISDDIMQAVTYSLTPEQKLRESVHFRPTIDGEFISDEPINLIAAGKFNDVPFISGTVTDEGMVFVMELQGNYSRLETFDENMAYMLPENLDVDINSDEGKALGERIRTFYFDGGHVDQSTLEQFVNVYTDTMFEYGVDKHVKLHAALATSPVYQYYFTFNGGSGTEDSFPGATHGEELKYLFYSPQQEYDDDSPEHLVMQMMVKLWTNFAKTGNPTPEEDPLLQNIIWSPATSLDHFYMHIDEDLTLERDLQINRTTFWEDIYVTVNKWPHEVTAK